MLIEIMLFYADFNILDIINWHGGLKKKNNNNQKWKEDHGPENANKSSLKLPLTQEINVLLS